jgi:hypothetical protein
VAITHVDTNVATSTTSSATCTKPAGTAQGDLMLAFLTANNQNATAPAGWTEIADDVVEIFRNQVFYKVAGASEPASYQFSVSNDTILVLTISSFRDVDTAASPIDITPVVETDLTANEPYTTPTVTGGTAGRLIYFRASRDDNTTEITYTASGVTELADHGIDNGSVAYSHAVYMANADYSGSGSKSGLAITANSTETHNFVMTLGIKAKSGPQATMSVQMPSLPSVSMTASWSHVATVNVNPIPMPQMTAEAFHGENEGPLDVSVPITVNIAGTINPRGTLDTVVTPTVSVVGETRFFGDNTVIPEREERWLVMTQDGYYLGIRNVTFVPLVIEMPLPVVNISATTAARAGEVADVPVDVPGPTPAVVFSAGAATSVATTANNATVLTGALAMAEIAESAVNVAEVSEQLDSEVVRITTGVESTDASAVAFDLIGFSATPGDAAVTVTAYNATGGNAKNVDAGHVSVTAVANSASVNGSISAPAGHAAVTVAIQQETEKITFSAGHASINCHN